jgi:hypothetical protein
MTQRPLDALAESRRAFERKLEELRGAVGSEVGRTPRGRGWVLPVAAAAAGLALAWKVVGRSRRRLKR